MEVIAAMPVVAIIAVISWMISESWKMVSEVREND